MLISHLLPDRCVFDAILSPGIGRPLDDDPSGTVEETSMPGNADEGHNDTRSDASGRRAVALHRHSRLERFPFAMVRGNRSSLLFNRANHSDQVFPPDRSLL
jgi:hypothetical protein